MTFSLFISLHKCFCCHFFEPVYCAVVSRVKPLLASLVTGNVSTVSFLTGYDDICLMWLVTEAVDCTTVLHSVDLRCHMSGIKCVVYVK